MSKKIRVVVCDDESAYRNALQKTLSLMLECEVIGVCQDGVEALELCNSSAPDVLLTDINMPRMNGIELIRRLSKTAHDTSVVVLTVDENDDTVFDAFRAGALGYLLKTSTPQDVVEAIRLAYQKEAKVTPKIAAKVIEDFRKVQFEEDVDQSALLILSDREIEILELISKGKRNRDISLELRIAEKTVKNHVSHILKALRVGSRTEAAMKAIKSRLVESD